MSVLDQACEPALACLPSRQLDQFVGLPVFSHARRDSRSGSELPPFKPASGIDGQSLPWGLRITSASKGRELHPHRNEVVQLLLLYRVVVINHFPLERVTPKR